MTVETVELSVEIGTYGAAHGIAVNFLKSLNSKGFRRASGRRVYKILTRQESETSVRDGVGGVNALGGRPAPPR